MPQHYPNYCNYCETNQFIFHHHLTFTFPCQHGSDGICRSGFLYPDVFPVTNPHVFPSKVVLLHEQTYFHRVLEVKETVCMIVVLIYSFSVSMYQMHFQRFSWPWPGLNMRLYRWEITKGSLEDRVTKHISLFKELHN